MTPDNRFKPPEAVLDPRAGTGERSRGPVIALALLGLLQLAWLVLHMPMYLRMVSAGVMNPVGPFLCLVGCVCLYAGLLRALLNASRGRNLFGAAVLLLLSGLMTLDAHRSFYGLLALVPFACACVIAAIGLALTWTRDRARKVPA